LRANLLLGNEPSVSEALYDTVSEELMEDNEEAGSRRAALFQKKFKKGRMLLTQSSGKEPIPENNMYKQRGNQMIVEEIALLKRPSSNLS